MSTKVEAQGGELVIRNTHGDVVIIPRNKRREALGYLAKGDHRSIDAIAMKLPKASDYAMSGGVYDGGEDPNDKIVKVNQNNEVKEYNTSSQEYRDLYNSGKLMNYDEKTDTYIAPPLKELVIEEEAPEWLKYKRNLEKQYSKDWYIDNQLPKWARSTGASADNMGGNQKGYDEYINNKLAESILKRNPKVGSSYNERLAWYYSLSEKEREIVNNSYSADKFSPAVRAYMESQSNEAKKYSILETFRDADKLAQSVEGTPERFRIFPNAENNIENYINPLMWIGDMAKGLGNVPKDIKEENYLKAVSSVASPLLGGALGGLGAKTTGQFVKNTFLPLGGLEKNIVRGGKNLVVDGLAGKLSKADKVIDATKVGSKVLNKIDDVVKPAISIADDVTKQTYKTTWQLEELPGLHLKSTMTDGAISKIVEPKTGLINTEQALGIIGKESGGADKVALIKQGLGENIPKKMDYNEFRKVVQDQLIPLEKQFSKQSSNYGISSLGYPSPKFSSFQSAIKNGEEHILKLETQIDSIKNLKSPVNDGNKLLENLTQELKQAKINLDYNKSMLSKLPLENQTLILGNKSKFGRGSSAHGNPDETLGHIHFLRDAETPDILTVTQIQSDAFQGTHRIMPKTQQEALEKVSKLKEEGVEIKSMFGDGKESSNAVLANYEKHLQLDEASTKNFTQKQLLDKNHQERYLQELVDYAGKRGDVNKIRVPTSETAAKVQRYDAKKTWNTGSLNNGDNVILSDGTKGTVVDDTFNNFITIKTENGKELNIDFSDAGYGMSKQSPIKSVNNVDVKEISEYTSEHQTILKKYSEQPKTIKKLFGQESKIVTDSKGNTWYEFDIPKKFKQGKGEIKAFQFIPPAISGAALYLQSQQEKDN